MGERKCGDCRLCCKLLSVDEEHVGENPYKFHKRAGKWCEHAGPGGCGIYTSPVKPAACSTFKCAWLEGLGEERDRPDKSKVVICAEVHDDWGNLIIVYESWPGIVRQSKRVQRMIDSLMLAPEVDGVTIIPSANMPRRLVHKRRGVQQAIPLNEQFTVEDLTVTREESLKMEAGAVEILALARERKAKKKG